MLGGNFSVASIVGFLYNCSMTTHRTSNRQRPESAPSRDTSNTPSDHIGLLAASMLLMAAGWLGLYYLITTALPRIGGELWLFFLLLQIAVTSTALPIVRYLNVRFTPINKDVPASGVIVRQSVWIGLFVVICAWLQIPRALSLPFVIFLAIVFVVVEIFLRTREIATEGY
jgi:hypothetical protein